MMTTQQKITDLCDRAQEAYDFLYPHRVKLGVVDNFFAEFRLAIRDVREMDFEEPIIGERG